MLDILLRDTSPYNGMTGTMHAYRKMSVKTARQIVVRINHLADLIFSNGGDLEASLLRHANISLAMQQDGQIEEHLIMLHIRSWMQIQH